MPRVSREQSEKHREKILEVAARLFRDRGFDGVSVADIMAAAGLTHGGFYGHFVSKDALAAEAWVRSFEENTARWVKQAADQVDPVELRREIVENYLSQGQGERSGGSCPVAAFAAHLTRLEEGKEVRAAYVAGLQRRVDLLAALGPARGTKASRRRRAIGELATLVGAILLARATKGDPMSDEILTATRRSLLEG